MDAGKTPEHIAGVISANVRLRFGFEQLLLVVTDRRIVVVHKGKKGAVGLASIWMVDHLTLRFPTQTIPTAECWSIVSASGWRRLGCSIRCSRP